MPGVPELQVPQVTPEAQPSPVEPLPPLGSFAGAHLGEGLASIGKEIYGIGWEEYHKAAEAFAQQKETEFQTEAARIRNEYKLKFNMDALARHKATTQALADARENILNTISSKYGRSLYNNSTLRIQRYAQEALDSHFEQQNKVVQFGSYVAKQHANVSDAAAYASDPVKVDGYMKEAEAIARKQYVDAAPDTIEAQVQVAQEKVASAVVKKLGDTNDPGLNAAIDKWGKFVSESVLNGARNASIKQHVAAEVRKIFSGIKIIDENGNENPFGSPDNDAVLLKLRELKDDEHYREIQHGALQEWHDAKALQTSHAEKLAARIRNAATSGPDGKPDGKFDLNRPWVSSDDKAALNAIGSTMLAALVEKEKQIGRRDVRWAAYRDKQVSLRGYQATTLGLWSMSDDAIKRYTPTKLLADMANDHPAMSDGDEARALAVLKKLQQTKPDAFERQVLPIVREEVNARFKGDPERAARWLAAAHDYAQVGLDNKAIKPNADDVRKEIQAFIARGDRTQRPAPVEVEHARPVRAPRAGVIQWEIGPDGKPRQKVRP
jgi:hypothetical protein